MKLKLTTILLLLSTLPMWGVEIFSRKINSIAGLPDDNVRSVLQDGRGFIWIGTPGGLYRFDGYFFNTYKYSSEGNNKYLNNNHILGIYKVDEDRILIAEHGNMLSVFDTRRNMFVETPESEKRNIYYACRKHPTDERCRKRFRHILNNGGSAITDNHGNTTILDNTGKVWFNDSKTGEVIELRVFDEKLFPLINSKKIKVLSSEKNGLIWISTNGCGITVYDRKEKTTQRIVQSSGLISTNFIIDMCMDDEDNVWVADEFHGIVHLTTARKGIDVRKLLPNANGLWDNQVSIVEWLSDSVLFVANTLGDAYLSDGNMQLPLRPAYKGLDIHAVCIDKNRQIWIGSRQKGLLAGDNYWHRHDTSVVSSIAANNVYDLLCDRKGRVWVACEDSHLDLAVREADGSYSFRHFFGRQFSARVLHQDRNGTIWVGTRNGLYCFNPDELVSDGKAYRQPLSATDLGFCDVSCICEDSKGRIWIGTIGSGVYCSNTNKVSFRKCHSLRLTSNDVQSIVEDNEGMMWFATKNGLTGYNPNDNSILFHHNEDNLMRNYYSADCATKLPDGRLALGTNAGIAMFRPEDIKKRKNARQRIDITDILVNGVTVKAYDSLSLEHDENTLTIRFSTFNYSEMAGTKYSYWLEGYDRDWSEPDASSSATYRNLPPGKYLLHIRTYGTGQLEDDGKKLSIIIQNPWWATWWAYMLYGFLLVAVCYVVYRQISIVAKLNNRIKMEKQVVEYKLQFFTNISHEFRTPLTIIKGAMERIKGGSDIPDEMRQPVSNMDKSVNRMMRLINQLMEFRKMQSDKLHLALEKTDVVKFLKDIHHSFRDIAENKQINYTFVTSEKSHEMYVDRSHLDKIIYNLLSNAFKYTPNGGSVRVYVRFVNGKMQLRIEDTGVGIAKEKQTQLFQLYMRGALSNNSMGIGLYLTKALVDIHKGSIHYEPGIPKGSTFVVELPSDNSAYEPHDFITSDNKVAEMKTSDIYVYKEMAVPPMNKRKVLIAEDDPEIVDYLRGILQRYFIVITANDGVEALETAGIQKPDLVITDIMMPLLNGLELVSRLRDNNDLKDMPIILITSISSDEKRIESMERGADAYITKPFDPNLLISTSIRLIQKNDMMRHRMFLGKEKERTALLPEIITEERDKRLLDTIDMWLRENIQNPRLSVDDLAEAMGYSRTAFFKKVKTLTGHTPADYIKKTRLEKAADLLANETTTVAEVCYKVGISEPNYFAKIFKKHYGTSPKNYQKGKR